MDNESKISENVVSKNKVVNDGQDLVKKIRNTNNLKKNLLMVGIVVLVVLGGVGTGWLISGRTVASSNKAKNTTSNVKKTKNEAGLEDESTFRDSAEGVLEKGGIGGEGTYHLVREGGPSQNVYLTSTVVDLGSFEGKKVKVWGETISARQAGWLMDIGKIKVIE